MKKNFLFLAALGLLTFGFVSCDPNDDTTNNATTPTDTTTTPTGPTVPDVPTAPTAGEWIDLGLPSGLLWASCNLGDTVPEGYGNYYAWAETQPKEVYNDGTYLYCNGSLLTKYCYLENYGFNGFTDDLQTLEPTDDAATVTLGSGARIPTKDEWKELIEKTTVVWAEYNGVSGCFLSGSNGNCLFLPAAGYRDGSELHSAGVGGWYWSSSLHHLGNPNCAWYFDIHSDGHAVNYIRRDYGQSVRAVRVASLKTEH